MTLVTDSTSTYDTHQPLVDRDALDRRISGLLPQALVEQLWLLLFDDDDVQMPAMIPIGDLPLLEDSGVGRGGEPDGEGIAELLGSLDREFGVASFVFVLERPGNAEPSASDRRRIAFLLGAADGRPFSVRSVYLCHDGGVRGFERPGETPALAPDGDPAAPADVG
jgi:hypothetical protein